MPVPGHFSLRPDHVMGSHYVNNRSASANFGQHHGHRGSYNSHYNSYNSHRQHQHHTENGSGEYDEYAGLMTTKEKQWLLNIQLLQLNTSQPYIDDYYYTVWILSTGCSRIMVIFGPALYVCSTVLAEITS